MTPETIIAIRAMDRLNSAARANPACGQNVIYFMKSMMLDRLIADGCVTSRRVRYEAKCHICGGSGWYRAPTPGRDEDGCHTCGGWGARPGSGRGSILDFTESTIALGDEAPVIWHTPSTGRGWPLWCSLRNEPIHPPGSWRPRLPGVRMEPNEVARDILTVEAWLGYEAHDTHTMDLGCWTEAPCPVCGREAWGRSGWVGASGDFGYYHPVRIGRVLWDRRVCESHGLADVLASGHAWDEPPVATHPAVAAWREAHPGDGRAFDMPERPLVRVEDGSSPDDCPF